MIKDEMNDKEIMELRDNIAGVISYKYPTLPREEVLSLSNEAAVKEMRDKTGYIFALREGEELFYKEGGYKRCWAKKEMKKHNVGFTQLVTKTVKDYDEFLRGRHTRRYSTKSIAISLLCPLTKVQRIILNLKLLGYTRPHIIPIIGKSEEFVISEWKKIKYRLRKIYKKYKDFL